MAGSMRLRHGYVVALERVDKVDMSRRVPKRVDVASSQSAPSQQRRYQARKRDSFGRLHERNKEIPKMMKQLMKIFPNKVTIIPPQDEAQLMNWKNQLDHDTEALRAKSNIMSIQSVTLLILILFDSVSYGLQMLQNFQSDMKSTKKSLKDVVTENEFEKRLLWDVIAPSDIGVTFDDIGALDNVKATLKELVMLPLQRPELFCRGQLTKESYRYSKLSTIGLNCTKYLCCHVSSPVPNHSRKLRVETRVSLASFSLVKRF
ncbi:hypothetical protein HPP92_013715 [Vanilla planifolia]|uniref:Uncharacterized protein n=1 Tax=Vanilla planifolia TaxID=51239 RepID=A0A835UV21_VANPL|nr:hypothetical protein HPP92_013715 [Vanilla planifolia]